MPHIYTCISDTLYIQSGEHLSLIVRLVSWRCLSLRSLCSCRCICWSTFTYSRPVQCLPFSTRDVDYCQKKTSNSGKGLTENNALSQKQWHSSGWQAAVYWWRRTLSPNCSGTREIPLRTNKIEERPETLLLLALIRTWEFRKCQDCGIRPSTSHGVMMQRLQKPLRFVHLIVIFKHHYTNQRYW